MITFSRTDATTTDRWLQGPRRPDVSPPSGQSEAHLGNGWIGYINARLARLAKLPPDWDGHGAKRIYLTNEIRDGLESFVHLAISARLPAPNVVPNPEGKVTLEWHAGSTTLEITPQGVDLYQLYYYSPEFEIESDHDYPLTASAMIRSLESMKQAIADARATATAQ